MFAVSKLQHAFCDDKLEHSCSFFQELVQLQKMSDSHLFIKVIILKKHAPVQVFILRRGVLYGVGVCLGVFRVLHHSTRLSSTRPGLSRHGGAGGRERITREQLRMIRSERHSG